MRGSGAVRSSSGNGNSGVGVGVGTGTGTGVNVGGGVSGYRPVEARGHKESVYAAAIDWRASVVVTGGTEKVRGKRGKEATDGKGRRGRTTGGKGENEEEGEAEGRRRRTRTRGGEGGQRTGGERG